MAAAFAEQLHASLPLIYTPKPVCSASACNTQALHTHTPHQSCMHAQCSGSLWEADVGSFKRQSLGFVTRTVKHQSRVERFNAASSWQLHVCVSYLLVLGEKWICLLFRFFKLCVCVCVSGGVGGSYSR